jgi:hypothetical protein
MAVLFKPIDPSGAKSDGIRGLRRSTISLTIQKTRRNRDINSNIIVTLRNNTPFVYLYHPSNRKYEVILRLFVKLFLCSACCWL